jgi:hypothetical protein
MAKIVIFFSVVASLFLLGQWYVFISVRKYLFERYTRISRKEAYLVLGLMGLANYVLVQLSFDPDILPAESFAFIHRADLASLPSSRNLTERLEMTATSTFAPAVLQSKTWPPAFLSAVMKWK